MLRTFFLILQGRSYLNVGMCGMFGDWGWWVTRPRRSSGAPPPLGHT